MWYRNRWIGSRKAAAALGRPAAPGPRRGGNDTVNTNVVGIGGRVFAVVEAGSFPVELSRSLEEQRYNPFDGTLAGSFTGHPHLDPLTGETHAIAYDGRVWDSVRHVVLSPTGRVVRDVPVAVEHGPASTTARSRRALRSCSTCRHVLLQGIARRLPLPVPLEPRPWGPGGPSSAAGRGSRHPVVRGRALLRVPRGQRPRRRRRAGDPRRRRLRHGVQRGRGRVRRPGQARALDDRSRDEAGRTAGARRDPTGIPPHRRAPFRAAPPHPLHGRRARRRQHAACRGNAALQARSRDGRAPGARVRSRPDPGGVRLRAGTSGAGEDEGWLVGFVIDTARDTTDFAILDARSFEAPPVATIHLGHRIPPGFHGNWFPALAQGKRADDAALGIGADPGS